MARTAINLYSVRDLDLPMAEILDRVAAATASIRSQVEGGPLRLTVLQSLAAKWLLPRLPDFNRRAPEIDVLLSATDRRVDLHKEDFHLALRFTSEARAQAAGLVAHKVMDEAVFPVCAPGLVDADPPLKTPDDLAGHIMLRDDTSDSAEDPGWGVWCAAAGIDPPEWRGPGYSDSALVAQAAIAGQGVALSRLSIVRDDLAAGRLVRPFGPVLRSGFSYWAICTPERARDRRVKTLVDWLQEQGRGVGDDPLLAEALDAPEMFAGRDARGSFR